MKACSRIRQKYERRNFNITDYHVDNEFDVDGLEEVLDADKHVCAGDEHIGGIERQGRTEKERARCCCANIPYRIIPKVMTRSMMEDIVYWLNAFPTKGGASRTISPATIVEGMPKPDMSYDRPIFGGFYEAYVKTTNGMALRTVPSIALKTGTGAKNHIFMNLQTGKEISSQKWKELPIDQAVIDRVEELGANEGQPIMPNGVPIFEWEPGLDIDDDEVYNKDDELIGAGEAVYDDVFEDLDGEQEDVVNVDEHSEYESDLDEEHDDIPGDIDDDDENESIQLSDGEDEFTPESSEDDTSLDLEPDEDDLGTEKEVDEDGAPLGAEEGANDKAPRRLTRQRQAPQEYEPSFDAGKKYNNSNLEEEERRQFLQLKLQHRQFLMRREQYSKQEKKEQVPNTIFHRAVNVMFTQMSAKEGIKHFGERAVAAIFKELKQLDEGAMPGKPVVQPIDINKLTVENRKAALNAINLIKQKRDDTIKGRTCADGSKQRSRLKEGESTYSPTVTLEGLYMTMMVAAFEGRDVATFDVPGAYLHAEMPKDKQILLKLTGELVDIMCDVNTEHKPNVTYEKGRKVLYMWVTRAIYGCIESALLWYNLYFTTLKEMGFKINEYDRCIANKNINGKQCTIAWYVDDNFVSHEDSKVVDSILSSMTEKFGDLKVTRGKKHAFLGVNFEFTEDGRLGIDMVEQCQEAIDIFDEKLEGIVKTPVTKGLKEINPDSPMLNEDKAKVFHSVAAKMLFITKRGRPDLEPTVQFMCTRVTKSTEQDWIKMRRLMLYLKNTINERRYIAIKDKGAMFTWVDAAYAVYEDMRSQTGGAISFGLGVVHCKSSRQKLNTKSSTESEVVGVSDYLPYNIWMTLFLKEQGMILYKNVLYQDNQSAMKMLKNGRESCTGNSRHIDIRYFFVKDRVDKGEVEVIYCMTEEMLADYFTKPLQGALFEKLRRVIMGWDPISILQDVVASKMKERVGNCEQNQVISNTTSTCKKNVGFSRKVQISE